MKNSFSFAAFLLLFTSALPAPVPAQVTPQQGRRNGALVLAGIPGYVGIVGHPLTFTVKTNGSSSANTTLTFSLENAPAGMTITKTSANTANVTWTPTVADYFAFRVAVTDAAGHKDIKRAAVHVYSDANAAANITMSSPTITRQSATAVMVTTILTNAGAGPLKDIRFTSAQLGTVNAVSLPGPYYLAAGNRRGIRLRFTGSTIAKGSYPLSYSGTFLNRGKSQPFTGKLTIDVP